VQLSSSLKGVRLTFIGTQAQCDGQDCRFRFRAERAFDSAAAVAFEHQVLDEPPRLGPGAVGRDIETKREQRAVYRANQRGTGTLTDFDGHEFRATLLEANFGLSDHGEFKPAGRE